jgi:hypothetical protein
MIAAKNNPFGAQRIQAIGYLPQDLPWQQVKTRLKQFDYTGAIVGPHGSGKTTLLRHLEKQLSQSGIQTKKLFINLDTKLPWQTINNCIHSIPPKGVLFVDGANHLPFLRFRQLRFITQKRHIGLVITSHHEGLLPTLVHCRPHLELLTELTKRLLPKDQTIRLSHLEALFESHRGNIRECLWQLYDEYAEDRQNSNSVLMDFKTVDFETENKSIF